MFGGIKNARFRRQVTPGDVLEITCTLTKMKGPVGIGEAKAMVDGQVAATAELTFAPGEGSGVYLTAGAPARGNFPGRSRMLEKIVQTAYKEFTLRFYHELFARFQDQETGLSAAEIFAAEAIRALGTPTVNEFAAFMHVSTPNAAYKINSLVRKGYVEKTRSSEDKREYLLHVTRKYELYCGAGRPRPERGGPDPGAVHPRGMRQIRGDAVGDQRGAAALGSARRRRAFGQAGPVKNNPTKNSEARAVHK